MDQVFVKRIPSLAMDLVMRVLEYGPDLLLIVGGSNPHLGGASLSQPYRRPDRPTYSASTSTISASEHQDFELTYQCAHTLAKGLGRRVIAVGGLHVDALTPEGLKAIRDAASDLLSDIQDQIGGA